MQGEVKVMRTDSAWKTTIDDLRDRANAVMASPADHAQISARIAAKCLSGVAGLVARRWTVDTMQRACADLVRHDSAWSTAFVVLPGHPVPTEPIQLLAVVARSLLPLAGDANLRAALAFWACEEDPAVWSSVAS